MADPDYGLSAMTGIIPVTIMAGVTTSIVKELFPAPTKAKKQISRVMKAKTVVKSTKKVTKRKTSVNGHPGRFSNVGL
jgi:hypothetical protein